MRCSVLLLEIASQLNDPISLTSAPVDHPIIAWKQSEFGLLATSCYLPSGRGSSGLWIRQRLTLGRRMLRPHLALALLRYIIRLMSMTHPHVRLRVAMVDDRSP